MINNTIVTKPTAQGLNDNTINAIATKIVEGKSQTQIGNDLNIHQVTVSKYSNKPEVKALTQRLRETLQEKHVHKFISRVVKTERIASKVNDYALGIIDDNPTRYETIEQQEKLLNRVDRTGLAIAKGVGILDTNTIHFGDNNTIHNQIISPAFQQFIDFQAKNGYDDDNNSENNA